MFLYHFPNTTQRPPWCLCDVIWAPTECNTTSVWLLCPCDCWWLHTHWNFILYLCTFIFTFMSYKSKPPILHTFPRKLCILLQILGNSDKVNLRNEAKTPTSLTIECVYLRPQHIHMTLIVILFLDVEQLQNLSKRHSKCLTKYLPT